jgi:23S rRNA (cytidine1920-2'-O)/16S rRNA (cytidine1409-2'-O)-methyltransferase
MSRAKKSRADKLVLERGLAETRNKAQALVLAGQVFSGDTRVDKPGTLLPIDAPLELRGVQRFVSRGGDKLDGALEDFAAQLSVEECVCLDVGASTGGFTDCLLQRGAQRVYAVDVGYGQLHPRLRGDERVDVRERTNARHLQASDFEVPIDLVVVDASFIGIGKLIDAIARVLRSGGMLLALVKPQFEAGREEVSRSRGVIRDDAVRDEAIARATTQIRNAGFDVVAAADSQVVGRKKGNREHFVLARRH